LRRPARSLTPDGDLGSSAGFETIIPVSLAGFETIIPVSLASFETTTSVSLASFEKRARRLSYARRRVEP